MYYYDYEDRSFVPFWCFYFLRCRFDRPIFATYRKRSHRNIRFSLTTGGKTTPLEQTTHCEARYNAGKRVYILTDDSWKKGRLTITALAQPDSESAIWQFEGHDMPQDARIGCVVCDVLRPKFQRAGDMNSDPADSFDPSPAETNKLTAEWAVGQGRTFAVLDCDSEGKYSLSIPSASDGQRLFDKAWKHHEWLANSIVFNTPDPYINTLGGALMAASDGRCTRNARTCKEPFLRLCQQPGDRRGTHHRPSFARP